jgi:UDP:flavonoid glycosyltransferase YjiC (YdhE family)
MRIAICPFDGVGHLNPLLAIASKLAHRGHLCRFYLMSDTFEASINSVPFPNVDVSRLYEEGGAHFSSLVPKHEDQDATDMKISDLPVAMVAHAYKYMPQFVEGLREFEADLIIYDPFVLSPVVAASILDLPCVSTTTVSNFNQYTLLCDRHTEEEKALGIEEHKQSKTLSKYHKLFLEKYDFDIFSRVVLLNNYLPQGLNLCSGIKDFEQKMPEVVKPVYGDMDKDCLYVGPMLLSKEEGRISVMKDGAVGESEKQWLDEPFPYDALREYKKQGKKIIYASFGTVATSDHFWDHEGIPTKLFGAPTNGKEFCRTLWGRIFEAFGGKENYVVVLATVADDPKALEGFEIPSNFIVRRKCPQLEVLKVADAFITHGGANSMIESINSHVPMLVLPWFSDQYDNAKLVSEQGVGLHYDKPLPDCTADFLASDILRLLINRVTFISNAQRLQKSLGKAGGADKASRAIEDYVKNFKGHQLSKPLRSNSSFNERSLTGSFREKCEFAFGSGSDFESMLPSFEA